MDGSPRLENLAPPKTSLGFSQRRAYASQPFKNHTGENQVSCGLFWQLRPALDPMHRKEQYQGKALPARRSVFENIRRTYESYFPRMLGVFEANNVRYVILF